MNKFCVFFFMSLLCAASLITHAQNIWPREVNTSNGGKITIYKPQPETFTGNILTGRAAVAVRKATKEEPVFGAMFFTATLLTDKTSRMAELQTLTINNAKFPGVENEAEITALSTLIQQQAPKWNLQLSIDDLVASIKKENSASGSADFKNEPPKIIYADKPTTLVVLDGEPQELYDKDLKAQKIVNSPNLIFKENNQWNLYVGGIWYKSTSVTSGWKQNTSLSAKVKSVNEQIKKQEAENNDGKKITDKPSVTAIVVTTKPAELLQTEGEADYKTVEGTSLLYVSNSPNEIFKDINSQKTYVLVAGRWYHAPGISGPWEYIASDKLPADFAKIPEGSDKDEVLANVGGTAAAEEARMEAEIPQTARVDRKTATINVEYDGDPQFEPIQGTNLKLAENANLTVMLDASGRYFALDNGVWFVSNSPNGVWSVANERPGDVDNIPASNPAYNAKFVYIYDQTPDYVYTGYTSGYMGGYIYGSTIVYGTGWRYRPWFRRFYFPRPVTWGFGFNYNPWNGWSMNWGYNVGFLYIGFYPGGRPGWGGGWFGPPMYRPPYRPPYWSGGYYGGNGRPRPPYQGGNRPGIGRPVRPGNGWSNNNNIYKNHKGVVSKDIDRRPVTRPVTPGNGGNITRPVTPGNGGITRPVTPGNGGITRPVTPGNGGITRPVTPGNGGITRPVTPGNGGITLPVTPGNGGITRPVTPGNGGVTRPVTPGNGGITRPVTPGNGNGTRPVTPGSGIPGNKLPGTTRPVTPGISRPGNRLPVAQPDVIADRDGNTFRKEANSSDWQTRDNKSRDWKPVSGGQSSRVPDLNQQQQLRERAATRETNFNRDVPRVTRPVPQTAKPATGRPSRASGDLKPR